MDKHYTPAAQAAIDDLRSRGFVVILWTPEEIGDADASILEDVAITRGNEYLADHNPSIEEEEEEE